MPPFITTGSQHVSLQLQILPFNLFSQVQEEELDGWIFVQSDQQAVKPAGRYVNTSRTCGLINSRGLR